MKTFQRYLSPINKGSIVEDLDLPAAVLDHLLAKFFKISETDGDEYEPDTGAVEFAAKYIEASFRRQVPFHCPFTI